MENEQFGGFVKDLMISEIAPCIISESITKEEAETFAGNVIDRFKNPNIQHKWISISVQYTGKMKMRNVPLLLKHYSSTDTVPIHMAIGFAAYLQFLKPVENKDNAYYGFANGSSYKIDDEFASWYFANWQGKSTEEAVKSSMSNPNIWGTDLTQLNGFYEAVLDYVKQFENGDFSKAY
jgi:tagaturonate reductase